MSKNKDYNKSRIRSITISQYNIIYNVVLSKEKQDKCGKDCR